MAIQIWTSHLTLVDSRPLPHQVLTIQQVPVSPSWAALEDTREKSSEVEKVFSLPGGQSVQLVAGQESTLHELWAEKIKEPVVVPPKYELLSGMIVSQLKPIETKIVASHQSALVEPSSFEQKAQELVQQELLRRQEEAENPKVRRVPVASGGHIIVAGTNTPQLTTTTAESARPQLTTLFSSPTTPPEVMAPATVVSLIEQSLDDRKQPYVLSGYFAVDGGLAYVAGAMKFELYHVLYGVPVSEGVLWEDQARFEISVKELMGRLVFRLVDMEGQVLGISQIQLQSLPLPPKNQQQITDLNMNLKPVSIGAIAEVISAYSIGNQTPMPVANAQVEIDGLNRYYQSNKEGAVDDPDILHGSSFVWRAKRKSFWGSLAVGLSGQRKTLQLFPEKMVEALLNLVARNSDEYEELREKSIIWGRVVQNGEPLAGAVVELASEFDVSPIYLNDIYLPDPNMEGTGRNGLFAFVGVTSGIQAVRAIVNGAYYPAKVIPTENHHVSHLDLEVGQSTVATIKVTGAPMRDQAHSAIFRIVGTDVEYRVDGEANVQWPKGRGLMLLEVDGGKGMDLIRMSLERESSEISVPMIPSQWLQQLVVEKRINLEGQKGVVVGFVNGKNFQVFLDDEKAYAHENIAYFNKNGEIVRGGYGLSGGGFVLFNVPIGFQSIHVIPLGSDQILSRTVIVEPAVANVTPEIFF